jgi:hypothetical protein
MDGRIQLTPQEHIGTNKDDTYVGPLHKVGPFGLSFEPNKAAVLKLKAGVKSPPRLAVRANGNCFRFVGELRATELAILIHAAPHVGWLEGCVGPRPPHRSGRPIRGMKGRNVTMDARGMTMKDLSEGLLPRSLDRAVQDKTGLAGIFDFHLEFTPDEATQLPSDARIYVSVEHRVMDGRPDMTHEPVPVGFRHRAPSQFPL